MGCGASRNVVAPQSMTIEAKPTGESTKVETTVRKETTSTQVQPPSPTPSQKSTSSRISIRSKSERPSSRAGKSSLRKRFEKMKQEVDLTGENERGKDGVPLKREQSVISKTESGATIDSGYADETPCMITEDSDPRDQEVANSCRPSTPELSISGTGLMSRRISSATTRHLQELRSTPRSLQKMGTSTSSPSIGSAKQESTPPPMVGVSPTGSSDLTPQIIQRPASRGGMAFDIQFTPEAGNTKPTPSKLMRLERRTKSAETLRQDIEERMRAAEQRKKDHEKKLLEKLERQRLKESSVKTALDAFAKTQTEKTHLLEKRMTATSDNREAHFKMLRERLQAQKEKAEKVRITKRIAPQPPSIPVSAE